MTSLFEATTKEPSAEAADPDLANCQHEWCWNSDREQNPLKHAPHPAAVLLADAWDRPYSREMAAYPAPWTRIHKYWPPVSRIDNVHGDRHLVCSCPDVASYG